MKKIVISLAGVMAATAFAPEAAAIPAYARQVGMACSACHQQHFPVLNSFGRAFKAGGYTMMGAQGKVEGEHLSLPDTLNASMIMKLRWQKDGSTAPSTSQTGRVQTKGDGQLQMYDEFAFLIGGKIADNVGFFYEGQLLGTGPDMGIMRTPFVFDMGAAKVSVVPFSADGGGAMVGYELSSGGILRANRWSEMRSETSAVQYNRNVESAAGFALVAQNDMGFVNLTKFTVANNFADNGGSSNMGSTYIRVAATPTIGNWDIVGGVGVISGQSYDLTRAKTVVTEQTFLDVQAHGQAGGKDLGVYFQYSSAPKLDANAAALNKMSAYNKGGADDRTAITIGADYSVIPHQLHVGGAYRSAKEGVLNASGENRGDNALTVQAIYDLHQNVALHGSYTAYSGSKYDGVDNKSIINIMLEMAW